MLRLITPKDLTFMSAYNIDDSKNGAIIGTVYKDMKGPLFPTVAVHSQNEEYVVLPFDIYTSVQ